MSAVFNAVNKGAYAKRKDMMGDERKLAHLLKDLQDWENYSGLEISLPDFHPVNSARAMRGCFFADRTGQLVPYATRVFEAYWGAQLDISREDVLTDVVGELDIDAEAFLEYVDSPEARSRLRNNTDELIARNGFGTLTIFIGGDDMYFGNDRLPLVENRLIQLATARSVP